MLQLVHVAGESLFAVHLGCIRVRVLLLGHVEGLLGAEGRIVAPLFAIVAGGVQILCFFN